MTTTNIREKLKKMIADADIYGCNDEYDVYEPALEKLVDDIIDLVNKGVSEDGEDSAGA